MKSAWIQVLLALVIGFTFGITFHKFTHHKHHTKCHSCTPCKYDKAGHGKHNKMKRKMLEHFSSELNLTPEQKTKVAAIFESKHQEMMKIREEVTPRFKALRKSTHDEINKILTPEQQKKFEELDSKFKSLHQKKHSRFED